MKVIEVENRKIVLKGVGEAFYRDGLPLSISIDICKDKELEVSLFHLADELIKNGFSNHRIKAMFIEEGLFNNDIEAFLNSEYEAQREMIFNYLWGNRKTALNWGRKTIVFE